jgi:hypothetical protein
MKKAVMLVLVAGATFLAAACADTTGPSSAKGDCYIVNGQWQCFP